MMTTIIMINNAGEKQIECWHFDFICDASAASVSVCISFRCINKADQVCLFCCTMQSAHSAAPCTIEWMHVCCVPLCFCACFFVVCDAHCVNAFQVFFAHMKYANDRNDIFCQQQRLLSSIHVNINACGMAARTLSPHCYRELKC